jgi:hypothetical protein
MIDALEPIFILFGIAFALWWLASFEAWAEDARCRRRRDEESDDV